MTHNADDSQTVAWLLGLDEMLGRGCMAERPPHNCVVNIFILGDYNGGDIASGRG